jgi:hypothetical protein
MKTFIAWLAINSLHNDDEDDDEEDILELNRIRMENSKTTKPLSLAKENS